MHYESNRLEDAIERSRTSGIFCNAWVTVFDRWQPVFSELADTSPYPFQLEVFLFPMDLSPRYFLKNAGFFHCERSFPID
jgi:hypothetical protein